MKKIFLYVFLFYLTGCKFKLPEALGTQNCSQLLSLSYVVDPVNPLNYTFTISNSKEINYPITWRTNSGLNLGTSNTNTFSYTFTNSSTLDVIASFKNPCKDVVSYSTKISVVDNPITLERNFTLTDPMVSRDGNAASVAVTNDGTVIATDNGDINVWNYSNQTLIRSFNPSNNNNPKQIVLSPDEKSLYVVFSGKIESWDWKTGNLLKIIFSNSFFTSDCVDLSPDGNFLAIGFRENNRTTFTVFDLLKNTNKQFLNNNEIALDIQLSKNANRIVYGTIKGSLNVLDYNTGNNILSQNYAAGYGFDIAPVGDILISTKIDYNVEIRNLNSGTTLKTINNFKVFDNIFTGPQSINISNDGGFVIIGSIMVDLMNQNQIIWDKNNNFNYQTSKSNFSNNSKFIITSTSRGDIALINKIDGSKVNTTSFKHPTIISNSFVTNDNKLLYTLDVTGIKAWNLNSGTINNNLNDLSQANRMDYGTTSVFLRNCNLSKYNSQSGELKFKTSIGNCLGLLKSSKKDTYVATYDFNLGKVNIYSGVNLSLVSTYEPHPNSWIKYMAFTPDEKYLISTGNDNLVTFYDLTTKQIFKAYKFGTAPNYFTTFNKRNDMIFVENSTTYSFNVITGAASVLLNRADEIFVLSPNDEQYTGVKLNNLTITNVLNNKNLLNKSFPDRIVKVQYNSTGSQIYITTEKEFYIINAPLQ